MNGKYLILSVLTSIVITGGVVGVVNAVGKPTHTRLVKEGNVVTKYVDVPNTVSDADLKEAVRVVGEWNQALSQKDWDKAFSLVYDTFITPMPKDWADRAKQADKTNPFIPAQFEVAGEPHIVEKWGTQMFNFIPDDKMLHKFHISPPTNEQEKLSGKYIFKYHMIFKEAIAVPIVQKGLDIAKPFNIYCVLNDSGQWRIAYSHAFELERDRPVSN